MYQSQSGASRIACSTWVGLGAWGLGEGAVWPLTSFQQPGLARESVLRREKQKQKQKQSRSRNRAEAEAAAETDSTRTPESRPRHAPVQSFAHLGSAVTPCLLQCSLDSLLIQPLPVGSIPLVKIHRSQSKLLKLPFCLPSSPRSTLLITECTKDEMI